MENTDKKLTLTIAQIEALADLSRIGFIGLLATTLNLMAQKKNNFVDTLSMLGIFYNGQRRIDTKLECGLTLAKFQKKTEMEFTFVPSEFETYQLVLSKGVKPLKELIAQEIKESGEASERSKATQKEINSLFTLFEIENVFTPPSSGFKN